MSPQFVDFDADGKLDIVAGIFDGSPHVARRDGAHWRQPEQILDRDGARIVGNQFWDFDAKKWESTDRCNPAGPPLAHSHVTSAIAFDWDRDGDLDLLLGDHEHGYVFLRVNEGSDREPRFAARNAPVEVDGAPLVVPGTVATLRAVDWTGDGRPDLLIGSMGDVWGDAVGGGVFVYPDLAHSGATSLGPARTLIEPSPKGSIEPVRPDAGLYVDAGDHDGDGDLDLVVGGYSMWKPPQRPLDAAQQQLLAELRDAEKRLTARVLALNAEMLKATEGLDDEAAHQKRAELLQTPERKALNAERDEVVEKIGALAPGAKRESFVWLYENRGR